MQICYIISQIDRAVAFEWICEELDAKRFGLEFILLNPGHSHLQEYLFKRGVPVRSIRLRGRRDYPLAALKIFWQLLWRRPNAVHVHLMDACLVALPVAWLLRISKRVLTRHHSDYHHKFAPKFVVLDKITAALSTHVIAITENVRRILLSEGVNPEKIRLVHHGFRLQGFRELSESKKNELRKKYSLEKSSPVIGVVARYIDWKGIRYIAEAFERILKKYPEALLFLANAQGPDAEKIRQHLKNIPSKNIREVAFEKDLFTLYHLFDAYVHAPFDPSCEAFGQTYVEALAAGIPSVFTLSGVAHEFIQPGKNALVVDYKNPDAIYSALEMILEKKIDLASIRTAGQESAKKFELSVMIKKLESIYAE